MVLLRLRDIPRQKMAPEDPTAIVPLRRGLGIPLFDLALLVPPAIPERSGLGRGVATLLESTGFRTTLIRTPPDSDPGPDQALLDLVADAQGMLVLCREGMKPEGIWLSWMLGHAAALHLRTAVLPVARRDAAREMWKLPWPLRDLPYLGIAKAVGEQEPSLWVLPPGKPPESREALNLDYWLHMR
ncbi:MAG: hypothetical protein EA427_03535 [Spirochaetaceae bacterium]|nr:MAG: hypothetical protein EA427_03535 [Spirochaetaceae bacterium]